MKSRLPYLICVSCLLCFFSRTTLAEEDPAREIRQLLLGWSGAADGVWSYDVFADVVVNVLSDGKLVKAHEHQIRQRYLNGKWRVDLLRTHFRYVGGKEEVWESNGDTQAYASNRDRRGIRYYSSRTHFGEQKTPAADVATHMKLLAPQLYETFKSHAYHESYWSMLGYRVSSGSLSRHSDSIEVRLPNTPSTDPHNHSQEDFLLLFTPGVPIPTRIRRAVGLDRDPEAISEFEIESTEIEKEIWVPVRFVGRVFWTEFSPDMHTPASEVVLALDRERSRVNVDIPAEVFELPFPPGTLVYDMARDVNYVVGEGNELD